MRGHGGHGDREHGDVRARSGSREALLSPEATTQRLSVAQCRAWVPVLEAMAAAVASAVSGVAGTEEGRRQLEIGAGGDRTSVVDRVAEDVVIEHCERLHRGGATFLLRSEELGERRFGADTPVLLVDPVDGSKNAMTGLPYYCTSLALLDGPGLGDTAAGVVRNLAGAGRFTAVRDGGVTRDGAALRPLEVGLLPDGRIPMLVIEGHRGLGGRRLDVTPLLRATSRIRLLGASALSLCEAAAGAASALLAPDGMRSFDCAAGLLVLAEAGAIATTLDGGALDSVSIDFGVRSPIVASLSAEVHARVIELLG